MKFTVKVEGIESLVERLKMLERIDRNEIKNDALNKAGEVMVNGLKESAPKDTGALGGQVEKEIHGMSVSIGAEGKGANGRDTVIYGFYQHFGSCRNTATNWVSVGYHNSRDEAIQVIIETLRSALGGS